MGHFWDHAKPAKPPGCGGRRDTARTMSQENGVDLYWLPLGAGGHFVRLNGRIYEAVAARSERPAWCEPLALLSCPVAQGTAG